MERNIVSQKKPGLNREVYLDILRIIAIFLVIFNHTGNKGFMLFTIRQQSLFFDVYLFCSIFCKIAVPVFFMISGALLLKKEEPLLDIIWKRFVKYAIVLLLISLFYYLERNDNVSAKDFIIKVYSSEIASRLWFLYAYLGFLLMLPLLRKMVKSMEIKDYLWLMGIAILFSALRCANFLVFQDKLNFDQNITVHFTEKTIFYPLMGYFLANKIDIKQVDKKTIIVCAVLSFLAIWITGWMTTQWCSYLGEWKEGTGQKFLNEFIYIPTCTVFLVVRYVCAGRQYNPMWQRIITVLGSSTFGIYLMDGFCRKRTMFIFTALDGSIPTFAACGVWVISVFLFGFVITQVLKRIPLIRKLI